MRRQPKKHHDWWKSHSAILGWFDVNYAHRTVNDGWLTEQTRPAWLLSLVGVGGKLSLFESHCCRFHSQHHGDGYIVSFLPA
jgi:hypothetical protein